MTKKIVFSKADRGAIWSAAFSPNRSCVDADLPLAIAEAERIANRQLEEADKPVFEVGKRYQMRNGETVKIVVYNDKLEYCLLGDNEKIWDANGRETSVHEYDLIPGALPEPSATVAERADDNSLVGAAGESPAHTDDTAVAKFANAMREKMAKKRDEGRGGWEECCAGCLWEMLHDHLKKGDPVDIGNFAMMIWNNQQSTAAGEIPAPQADAPADGDIGKYSPETLTKISTGPTFKVGDYARRRDGKIVGPLKMATCGSKGTELFCGEHAYPRNGLWSPSWGPHACDLIEVVPAPQADAALEKVRAYIESNLQTPAKNPVEGGFVMACEAIACLLDFTVVPGTPATPAQPLKVEWK